MVGVPIRRAAVEPDDAPGHCRTVDGLTTGSGSRGRLPDPGLSYSPAAPPGFGPENTYVAV